VIVVPIELGGFGKIFAAVPPAKLLLAVPGANTTGSYGVYARSRSDRLWRCSSTAFHHRHFGGLKRSRHPPQRRNAAGYSFMLGLLALVGFFAIAAGVSTMPEFAGGFKHSATTSPCRP